MCTAINRCCTIQTSIAKKKRKENFNTCHLPSLISRFLDTFHCLLSTWIRFNIWFTLSRVPPFRNRVLGKCHVIFKQKKSHFERRHVSILFFVSNFFIPFAIWIKRKKIPIWRLLKNSLLQYISMRIPFGALDA